MVDPAGIKVCAVIGASHAGVNFAFALRRAGWEGEILLFDKDPEVPYHRPPLSKTFLTSNKGLETIRLKPLESFHRERITLHLGVAVRSINRKDCSITLDDGRVQFYHKLVIATGARPLIPAISGIDNAENIFPLRTAGDVTSIRQALLGSIDRRVVIIGGGYIGLEAAASLRKLGAEVTVLEREPRILARVTAPEMSEFFQELHEQNGVRILTDKNVESIGTTDQLLVSCSDGSQYVADLIIVGAGIRVNLELAEQAGLAITDGIEVNAQARTQDENVYAIGDCTYHHNPHYDRFIRLESVQNAVDQAKVAAAAICNKNPIYDTVPWFWSDQFDVKLQMTGLSEGYDQVLVRQEVADPQRCFSIWYFNGEHLLAVDAVNNAKAYVLGTKFIKSRQNIDKSRLADASVELKPANFIIE